MFSQSEVNHLRTEFAKLEDTMDHKKQAKKLLTHYFRVLFQRAALTWERDYQVELEDVVDHIIAAAVQELKKES